MFFRTFCITSDTISFFMDLLSFYAFQEMLGKSQKFNQVKLGGSIWESPVKALDYFQAFGLRLTGRCLSQLRGWRTLTRMAWRLEQPTKGHYIGQKKSWKNKLAEVPKGVVCKPYTKGWSQRRDVCWSCWLYDVGFVYWPMFGQRKVDVKSDGQGNWSSLNSGPRELFRPTCWSGSNPQNISERRNNNIQRKRVSLPQCYWLGLHNDAMCNLEYWESVSHKISMRRRAQLAGTPWTVQWTNVLAVSQK